VSIKRVSPSRLIPFEVVRSVDPEESVTSEKVLWLQVPSLLETVTSRTS